MDRRPHLLIGAAATDVGDGVVDVGVGRLRLLAQQRRHRHDHAGLTVAALRHVVVEPGLLHLAEHAALGEPFDRGDLLAYRRSDWQRAGAGRHAVEQDGAGAALRDPAAVFGAGEADVLPQRPKQGRVGLDLNVLGLAVDSEGWHSPSSQVAAAAPIGNRRPRLQSKCARSSIGWWGTSPRAAATIAWPLSNEKSQLF